MAKAWNLGHQGRRSATLALACLSFAYSAPTQTHIGKSNLIVLNRKEAANLVVTQTRPEYPALAKVNYIQGRVRLQLLVSREGKVTEVNVVEGHPFLAVAALNAIRHWVYRPLLTPAGPVPFVTVVEVNFSLRNIQPYKLPPEAVKDLNRQVRPPHVIDLSPAKSHLVHLRVLVGDNGQAVDVNPVSDFPNHYDDAMRMAGHLKFQPARWGSINVPWYLDVEVPADTDAVYHGNETN